MVLWQIFFALCRRILSSNPDFLFLSSNPFDSEKTKSLLFDGDLRIGWIMDTGPCVQSFNLFFESFSVDGGFTEWSEWSTCSQVGGEPAAGDCLCRSRTCTNPKPIYGGAKCDGPNVEVANCTGKSDRLIFNRL